MIPRSHFSTYLLDFIQQIMERDKNENISNVLKLQKEKLDELIARNETEEQV